MFIVYRTCASVIRFSGKQNKVVTTMTIVVIITKDMQDYKSVPQESRLHELFASFILGPQEGSYKGQNVTKLPNIFHNLV
jgi:hypothetical protein